MNAVTLTQPWASLVAAGIKRVETRSWPCPPPAVGQPLAIHAAKGLSPLARQFDVPGTKLGLMHVCAREPYASALTAAGLTWEQLPLGAVVATTVVKRCSQMTNSAIVELRHENPREAALGGYRRGRFAWVLGEVTRVDPPVPFKGAQQLFQVPDQLLLQERLL